MKTWIILIVLSGIIHGISNYNTQTRVWQEIIMCLMLGGLIAYIWYLKDLIRRIK